MTVTEFERSIRSDVREMSGHGLSRLYSFVNCMKLLIWPGFYNWQHTSLCSYYLLLVPKAFKSHDFEPQAVESQSSFCSSADLLCQISNKKRLASGWMGHHCRMASLQIYWDTILTLAFRFLDRSDPFQKLKTVGITDTWCIVLGGTLLSYWSNEVFLIFKSHLKGGFHYWLTISRRGFKKAWGVVWNSSC